MKRFFLTYGISFLALVFLQQVLYAQESFRVNSYGVNMVFVEERAKIQSTDLASNILKITNNTKKDMTLSLQITPPAGWKMFGKEDRFIDLKAGDSAFVPVRVRPMYNIKGNTNYVVNAYLASDQFTITNSIWYISVDKLSHWNVYTPENKVYFKGQSDTSRFQIQISNNGNSDEALLVDLKPEKEIEILEQVNGQSRFPVFLKVGQDTTLFFSARYKSSDELPLNGNNTFTRVNEARTFRVKVQVRNERPSSKGSSKLWSGNIDFVDLPDKTKIMDAGVTSIPMTVELNTFDIMTQSTFSALNIYGSKTYENNSILTYYYQADFVQNQINLNSYLGNYIFLSYFHKRFMFELGDIGSNRPGSTLNGKGLKAALNLGNHQVGGLFIRKPKLFDSYYAQGYGGFHTYRGKKLFVDNYYQHVDNSWTKVANDFATTDWNWMVKRGHVVRFGGGYSLDNHYWNPGQEKTVAGYGFKLGYSASYKRLNVTLNSMYGSKTYTPWRGTFSVAGNARYRINTNYSISGSAYRFSFNPEIYSFGVMTNDSVYNIQDNYSLKLNYQKDQNVFIFQPRYYTINSNPVASRTRGMAFEYRRLSRTAFKFYVNLFAGYTRFDRNPELNDIFISYVQSSLRYKRLQFNTRYYYGPYFTIEQVDYVQNQINPQRLFTTLFYDYWFMQNKFRLNVNLNHFYTTKHNRQQLITMPELFYYSPGGFRFSMYVRYSFMGEGEYSRRQYNAQSGVYTEQLVEASKSDRFEIGAGIMFNVNMPTGLKRFYKVKVIAFRDLNGNGVKDPGEKGIDDMLIMLQKNDTAVSVDDNTQNFNELAKIYELVTNSKGFVEYENIPVGEYVITARPLGSSMGGWFDGKTFYRTIDKNKEIYIPLSKGARISGGVLMERAKFTDDKPVFLGNIRVTAVHTENGKTFSTLTDKDGQFVLYAPNGSYHIMINEQAVGSRFEFLRNNIPLTISKEFENYNVSFYLVEKERKIRMGGNGTKPQSPINRKEGSSQTQPKTDAPQGNLSPKNYLPVDSVKSDASTYVVVLYQEAQGRKEASAFQAAQGLSQIRCIALKAGGYQYITEGFAKEKQAIKLSKKLAKAGFTEAYVKPMVFE